MQIVLLLSRAYLDGVLDFLLQLMRDVIAMSNVTDTRQRRRLRVLVCERGEPATPIHIHPPRHLHTILLAFQDTDFSTDRPACITLYIALGGILLLETDCWNVLPARFTLYIVVR
jgi:hypothetical protein